MRTNGQQERQNGPPPMYEDLKTALTRNPATLARDFAGAAALMVMLLAGLSLPALS